MANTQIGILIMIAVVAVWQMWVGFVALMHIRRIRDRYGLTMTQRVFGYPTLAVYYTLDLCLRLTVFSLLLLRPPRWETLSALLERESGDGKTWRERFSRYVREDLLADFDPRGDHGEPGRDS